MRFTRNEMIEIATGAESRSANPDYKKIMEKFDRVLLGKTKYVRLTINEKDLVWYMFEGSGRENEIEAKLYF